NGPDSFTYRVNDGMADSNVATVTLSVTAVNDAPVATDDVFTTAEDTELNVLLPGVMSNDSDIENNSLTAAVVTGPSHGSLTLNVDGSFKYTPAANYNGPDSFTYRVNDGTADSNVATVTLNVTAVNDAPLASNDTYTIAQDSVLTVTAAGVLVNDQDVDGDLLNASQVMGPAHGTLVLNSNGSFVYTPTAGYSGPDTFTYVAQDGTASSGIATVSIQVTPVIVTGGTKFYVVDASARGTFGYDADGIATSRTNLNRENAKPRGIASNRDGSKLWTIDEKGDVFVYNDAGKLLGSWTAKGLGKPEGITTDGVNLWVVDDDSNRVYYFAGAASRLRGSISATSSFALNRNNKNAMDVVTDGTHLWVVNDTAKLDNVFRYTIGGVLEGSWQIDTANKTPTGLTIDPNDVDHIWIVDAGSDRVYQYTHATTQLSGVVTASASFALNTADRNPQGIADPRTRAASNKARLRAAAHDAAHSETAEHKTKAASSSSTTVTPSLAWLASSRDTTHREVETHAIDGAFDKWHDAWEHRGSRLA
ncbi:MAG: tandem-95 repeat protein, partial [Planctomycetaceae bacterium]|nr:tandem-95 repeat protein [Planctomycetaceae bacterium]